MNLKTPILAAVSVLAAGGLLFGGVTVSNNIQADRTAHTVAVAQAAQDKADALAAADTKAAADAAAQQKIIDDVAAAKAAADALAAQQAAQAAADAAAAQAAQAAAAKAAAVKTPVKRTAAAVAPVTGLIKCPAGSTANSGDQGNDTSCFPDICFRIMLPDAAHPECVTPFKP